MRRADEAWGGENITAFSLYSREAIGGKVELVPCLRQVSGLESKKKGSVELNSCTAGERKKGLEAYLQRYGGPGGIKNVENQTKTELRMGEKKTKSKKTTFSILADKKRRKSEEGRLVSPPSLERGDDTHLTEQEKFFKKAISFPRRKKNCASRRLQPEKDRSAVGGGEGG